MKCTVHFTVPLSSVFWTNGTMMGNLRSILNRKPILPWSGNLWFHKADGFAQQDIWVYKLLEKQSIRVKDCRQWEGGRSGKILQYLCREPCLTLQGYPVLISQGTDSTCWRWCIPWPYPPWAHDNRKACLLLLEDKFLVYAGVSAVTRKSPANTEKVKTLKLLKGNLIHIPYMHKVFLISTLDGWKKIQPLTNSTPQEG